MRRAKQSRIWVPLCITACILFVLACAALYMAVAAAWRMLQ